MVRRSKICSQFVIIVYDGGRYSTDLRTQKPLKTIIYGYTRSLGITSHVIGTM